MVGSRQITLSVFRQLDWVPWDKCEPMGRVNDEKDKDYLDIGFVVGKHKDSGVLCRARLRTPPKLTTHEQGRLRDLTNWGYHSSELEKLKKIGEVYDKWWDENGLLYFHFQELPLIVLAGLK